jgi:hypothetical protein
MDLVVYSLFGQEVKRTSFQSRTTQTITMDRVNLPDGIYFYKLMEGNKLVSTGKFIAE